MGAGWATCGLIPLAEGRVCCTPHCGHGLRDDASRDGRDSWPGSLRARQGPVACLDCEPLHPETGACAGRRTNVGSEPGLCAEQHVADLDGCLAGACLADPSPISGACLSSANVIGSFATTP